MNSHEQPNSLLRDYLGFDRHVLMKFAGLVAAVVFVVTGLYVAIFGFDTWASNMEQAGSMMLANFDPPPPAPPQSQFTPVAAAPTAQYVCPSCGAVGLPLWTRDGTPRCPVCQGVMISGGRTAVKPQLAARP
jgi:hypothetical protein